MELIPGLPDDVARDCLVRVVHRQFSTVVSVCKAWRTELDLPEFHRHRKLTCNTQKLVVMAQALVDRKEDSKVVKYRVSPVYRLTLVEPDTGDWCDLPPIPGFSDGLPMFCQVVSVGSDIVVLGVRRSFFGCASDSDRMVFVVGGHDGEKNALRSGIAYDVRKDEWVPLPNMARERDECKAVFHSGKLHVIGGYCTEMQGRFEKNTEVFDFAMWKWNDMQDNFLETAMCPRTCTSGDDGMYMCCAGDVLALRGTMWQAIAKLPCDVSNIAYVETWQGKLLVIGSAGFGEPHMAYVLDLKKYRWTKMGTPEQYSGHVQSGGFLALWRPVTGHLGNTDGGLQLIVMVPQRQ
ncbi:hypothetical protein GH714_022569 [Hevea brasiliensis]|uniref:F-box domain-containing protein n=1 Tax=Hevea brasiliensis TaxID=3981 RepID=A0A6A6LIR1_HEVBR|nr:hypothetical protein GH714_022569 [Hevea brasiliensis]